MHIPDSVLSPATSAVATAAMLPIWALAARRVRQSLRSRQVPLLALGSAFCFTTMLFNIPALGGTTAHPVAGTLLAITLGPWAAVLGLSIALAIQALIFGDGGVLAYGANCFTMAFVLPFVGYSLYRLLARRLPARAAARSLCAALGAYVGLNAAAAVVAVLLGVQPALFHEPGGQPLYFPFGLKVTLPAMLGTHLLIAGPAEAIVTGLVVTYLQAARIPLYRVIDREAPAAEDQVASRGWRRETLWIGLLTLIALSPLGLLARGDAWGEWDSEGLKQQIRQVEGKDYLPKGVARAEAQEYKGVRGLSDYAQDRGAKGYLGAAALGAGVIVILLLLAGRALARPTNDRRVTEEGNESPTPPGVHNDPALSVGTEAAPGTPAPELPAWLRERQTPIENPGSSLADQPWAIDHRKPTIENRNAPAQSTIDQRPSTINQNRFLERTLGEIAAGAAQALQSERWAGRPGYLQRLDPRAKALSLFGLIAVVACLHNLATLLALYVLTVALAIASRLPVGMLARRVWLSVPLFISALALPAALNVVSPGRELCVLWTRPHLALTAPGLAVAAGLTLRVGVAVSLATLLTLTTRWNDLLRALRMLRIPRLFVSVLAMTYRYLAVLLQTAGEMFVARRSRTVGRTTNAEGRRFVGHSIGALFGKTLALSEEVHAAMVSRGFNGEIRTLTRLQWRLADTLWTLAIALLGIIALGGEYARFLH